MHLNPNLYVLLRLPRAEYVDIGILLHGYFNAYVATIIPFINLITSVQLSRRLKSARGISSYLKLNFLVRVCVNKDIHFYFELMSIKSFLFTTYTHNTTCGWGYLSGSCCSSCSCAPIRTALGFLMDRLGIGCTTATACRLLPTVSL